MKMSDNGKGDKPRPFSVPMEVFTENFETIFGKKTTKPQPQIEPIPFAGMVDTGEDDGLGINSN
jgi:hypothetical protein